MSYDNEKIILFSDTVKHLSNYMTILGIFTELEDFDKFGKYNDAYFITKPGILQMPTRHFYGQDRTKSCEFLKTDFQNFAGLLDNILTCLKSGCNYKEVKEFIFKILNFVNRIIPGLYSIKITYPDYTIICNRVDSIILTLIDFRNETNQIITEKNKIAIIDTFSMCQSLDSINRLLSVSNKQRSNSSD
jgi:hypothetical protein